MKKITEILAAVTILNWYWLKYILGLFLIILSLKACNLI